MYQIRNRETGHSYVGSSATMPMNRWLTHVGSLKTGVHTSSRFQQLFDEQGRDLTKWEFLVVDCVNVSDDRELRRIEAEWILQIPAEKRLNMPSTSVMTREKHAIVLKLLQGGCKGYEVARQVGLSPAMISRIKRANLL